MRKKQENNQFFITKEKSALLFNILKELSPSNSGFFPIRKVRTPNTGVFCGKKSSSNENLRETSKEITRKNGKAHEFAGKSPKNAENQGKFAIPQGNRLKIGEIHDLLRTQQLFVGNSKKIKEKLGKPRETSEIRREIPKENEKSPGFFAKKPKIPEKLPEIVRVPLRNFKEKPKKPTFQKSPAQKSDKPPKNAEKKRKFAENVENLRTIPTDFKEKDEKYGSWSIKSSISLNLNEDL